MTLKFENCIMTAVTTPQKWPRNPIPMFELGSYKQVEPLIYRMGHTEVTFKIRAESGSEGSLAEYTFVVGSYSGDVRELFDSQVPFDVVFVPRVDPAVKATDEAIEAAKPKSELKERVETFTIK